MHRDLAIQLQSSGKVTSFIVMENRERRWQLLVRHSLITTNNPPFAKELDHHICNSSDSRIIDESSKVLSNIDLSNMEVAKVANCIDMMLLICKPKGLDFISQCLG